MKYYVDYQFLPKGADRPIDDGNIAPLEFSSENGMQLVPQVGDYIQLLGITGREHTRFSGRVKSRLFRIAHDIDNPDDSSVGVNIIVEDDDADWGKLIKE